MMNQMMNQMTNQMMRPMIYQIMPPIPPLPVAAIPVLISTSFPGRILHGITVEGAGTPV